MNLAAPWSADTLSVHDELDSTSDEAARLLGAGRRPPFLVVARRQTSGRGQRGAQWISTEGNLHMTLVLPSSMVETRERSLLPQKCGVLIAHWFRDAFHVPLTLKWPNDLMLGQSKCGGLLCESSFQGGSMGPVLIGLGVNLTAAPALATSLTDFSAGVMVAQSKGSLDAVDVAQRLSQHLLASWQTFKAEQVPQAFEALVTPAARWWRRMDVGHHAGQNSIQNAGQPTAVVQRMRAVGDDGSLLFEDGTNIQTAGHFWRPLFMDEDVPVLTADVGNTRTKVVMWQAGRVVWSAAGQTSTASGTSSGASGLESAQALVRHMMDALWPRLPAGFSPHTSTGLPVWVVGVNPEREEEFARALADVGMRHEKLPRERILTRGDYRGLGHDRLAMIEAWAQGRGAQAGEGALILSCGTAATLDLMDGRLHRGGWIMPGMRTSLRAMHEGTGLLPLPSVLSGDLTPGLCTEDAMSHGVALQLAGAVVAASGTKRLPVVLTGGDAPVVQEMLSRMGMTTTQAPTLVAAGALILAGIFRPSSA